MSKEMLITTVEGQECRIAIASDGRLEELYIERTSSVSHVGNIYKGRVTNVESAIQAAFIDFGRPKNGFLHISDIHPNYFADSKKSAEPVGRRRSHYERPPIQDCLRRGQEVVVQMTKEGIGTKGPTMTTYLSIPGRLLVMMPGMSRLGVSRKIEDEEARQRARKILSEVKVPEDMGFIVRTAGADKSKRDIQRDMSYLLRLWKAVEKQIKTVSAPAEIYEESDLVTRTIRDVYDSDIERIICDSPAVEKQVRDFLAVAMPRGKHAVKLYTGTDGLFHDHGIEDELERIYNRHVDLPSGGSLVIDQTEALVAIDVNSGRNRRHSDAETTALRTNQEAAKEIARQLRLRDLGGLVVVDFIDMREDKNCRAVDRCFREAMKPDRAKTKILRISTFGLVEMTRQRLGPSLKSSMYRTCEACDGMGVIKSEESQALQVMRTLQRTCAETDVAHVHIRVTPAVAHHLNNHHRALIARLETETERTVVIQADPGLVGEECVVKRANARGSEIVGPSKRQPGAGKRRSKKAPAHTGGDEADQARAATLDDEADDDWRDDGPEMDVSEHQAGEADEAGQSDKAGEPASPDAAAKAPEEAAADETSDAGKKSRRRGRRGGRGRKRAKAAAKNGEDETPKGEQEPPAPQDKPSVDAPPARKRTTRAAKKKSPSPQPQADEGKQAPPKAKRRRRKKAAKKTSGTSADDKEAKTPSEDKADSKGT